VIEIPRSTYYYHPHSSEDGLTDERLAALIDDVHDVFPGYGYRRVTRELVARGVVVNHKRVARVMRQYGLGAIRRRRFVRTTDSRHNCPIFPNLYRNSIPKELDKVWVADITYVALATGFAFLAAILDACSRKVVGYAIGRHIDTELTLAALEVAVRTRSPEPGRCIHHSDRGCQYSSAAYRDALARYGLVGSMSGVANPYDNAQAESFMKTLKVEEVYLSGYETFSDAASRLPVFIDDVYNARRMHSALGYVSPNRFERLLAQQAA
jgi:putative transposase